MGIQWRAPTVCKTLGQELRVCSTFSHCQDRPLRGRPHLIQTQTATQEGGLSQAPGLRAGHGEARAGLVFLTVPELITAKWVPIPHQSSQLSTWTLWTCPPVGVGGSQRPLSTRQALCPWDSSRTLGFLSYALRGATPTRGSACRGRPPTPTPPPPPCAQWLPLDPRQP